LQFFLCAMARPPGRARKRCTVKQKSEKAAITWPAAAKIIAKQANVHRHETAALHANHSAMKEALTEAVKTIDWLRAVAAERWTPADAAKLAEWRELAR